MENAKCVRGCHTLGLKQYTIHSVFHGEKTLSLCIEYRFY